MLIKIKIGAQDYQCDLEKSLDISIPLINNAGVIAFGADAYKSEPYTSGDFIGNIENGSPVNFYNIFINPHGNGTHTESVKHIDNRGLSIYDTLKSSHFISKLVSLNPDKNKNLDSVITERHFNQIGDLKNIKALIIRTIRNSNDKLNTNYTGTNPCYIDKDFMKLLNETEVEHLLVDIPSVDREVDGGELLAHKTFWKIDDNIALKKTITEMIYVDNNISDGLYLLNLQIISVDIDASPSKPILFELKKL